MATKIDYDNIRRIKEADRNGLLTIQVAFDILGNKKSKYRIPFICEVCGIKSSLQYRRLIGRTYFKLRPICRKCVMKKVTSTAEWKKTNSEAQLLIQGTPEQKKKNAEAVSKACKRPSVKKKKSESAKKMWKDPEYRKKGLAHLQKIHSDPKVIEKQQLKNRFHTGYYESKFGRMFFNSSWELSFIKYCENNDYVDMMSRFNGYIEYIDCEGVARKYFPDFVVEIRGHKFIVEIKGGWEDSDIIKRKCDAARKFVELNDEYDDFFIYRKRELEKLGVLNETYESN